MKQDQDQFFPFSVQVTLDAQLHLRSDAVRSSKKVQGTNELVKRLKLSSLPL